MAKIYRLHIDPLDDWIPLETEDEMHARVFSMTNISAKALGWSKGGEQFFEAYNRFLTVAKKAQKYHDHLVLMALLMLKEMVEESGITFDQTFEGLEGVEDHMKEVVKNMKNVLEHLIFATDVTKSREQLEMLPKGMRTVSFDFALESQTGADTRDSDYQATLEDIIDPEQFSIVHVGYDEADEDFDEMWEEIFGSDDNKGEDE